MANNNIILLFNILYKSYKILAVFITSIFLFMGIWSGLLGNIVNNLFYIIFLCN
jgi:hypothetical protein